MATQVGLLDLTPGLENIGLMSNFSGDPASNNQATLHYRRLGDAGWRPGVPMVVDHRAEVIEYDPDAHAAYPVPNPNRDQARAIIWGLTPDTDYEVRVSYDDPDGVTGSPVIEVVRTRTDSPPQTGQTYYVAPDGNDADPGTTLQPWQSLVVAVPRLQPGDRLLAFPGTYNDEVEAALSGASDNYISIEAQDPANKPIVQGGRFAFRFTGSWVKLKGFDMRNPVGGDPGAHVVLGWDGDPPAEGIIVEDCDMTDPMPVWAGSGILIRRARNCTIQRNLIQTVNLATRGQYFGIFFWGSLGGHVIRENRVLTNGILKDGIGGAGNFHVGDGPGPNSFIYDNYVWGAWDDAYEIEGGNANVAVWGNMGENNEYAAGTGESMNMGIGLASVVIGPAYVLRNTFVEFSDSAIKLGSSSFGPIFIYHNTMHTRRGGNGPSHFGNDSIVGNVTFKNNIVDVSGRCVHTNRATPADPGYGTNVYDHNAYYTTRNDGFQAWWFNQGVDLNTLDEFRAVSGQEAHGFVCPDPMFANPAAGDFRLQEGSPCRNAGEILPGFNDADSPWPFKGSAPDLGAFEFDDAVATLQARFTATPTSGRAPLMVRFTDTSSGIVDAYQWDFGDGTGSSVRHPVHEYVAADTYTVILTVSGPEGSSQASAIIQVDEPLVLPTAVFSADPASGEVPLTVQFTNESVGDITSHHWDFGDGDYSDELHPVHAYGELGVFTVTLTVTGPLGSDSVQRTIEVQSPVIYTLTIEPAPGGTTFPRPGAYPQHYGDTVNLVALPDSDFVFQHWLETGQAQNPLTVPIVSDITRTPVFEYVEPPPNKVVVTIAVVGPGLTDPAPGAYEVDQDTSIVVNAVSIQLGYRFAGWTGDVSAPPGPLTVLADRNMSIVAVFEPMPPNYGDVVLSAGAGGTTSPPPGTHRHEVGKLVYVSALPDSDFVFLGWRRGGVQIGSANPLQFVIDEAQIALDAEFEPVETPPEERVYTIAIIGLGSTNPAPEAYQYLLGTEITVEATPELGWAFAYWAGDVTGTEPTIAFTLDRNMSVVAVFTPQEQPPQEEGSPWWLWLLLLLGMA